MNTYDCDSNHIDAFLVKIENFLQNEYKNGEQLIIVPKIEFQIKIRLN